MVNVSRRSAQPQPIQPNPPQRPATAPPAVSTAAPAAKTSDRVQTTPTGKAAPSLSLVEPSAADGDSLKTLKTAELKSLGATNKKGFFAALLPAALESERKYGVPAEVILAQAALESGWGKHAIGGYNIFGIKGSGPAGSVSLATHEGSGKASRARFAKFHNFHEAIVEHGKMYNNGAYSKGMSAYAKNKDAFAFVDAIASAYATAPDYASQVKSVMRKYGLHAIAESGRHAAGTD